jgi:hypothetical protein
VVCVKKTTHHRKQRNERGLRPHFYVSDHNTTW